MIKSIKVKILFKNGRKPIEYTMESDNIDLLNIYYEDVDDKTIKKNIEELFGQGYYDELKNREYLEHEDTIIQISNIKDIIVEAIMN